MESSHKASNVEVLKDILINTQTSGSLAATKYVLLEKTGAQVFTTNATDQPVQWAEVEDVGGWFDSGSSTTVITVPSDVYFIDIFLNLTWAVAGNEAVNHARILRNSGDLMTNASVQHSLLYSNDPPYPNSSYINQIDTHLVPVSPGDTIIVHVDTFQDTALNPAIQAGATSILIVAWPFKEGV